MAANSTMKELYGREFYVGIRASARASAEQIVPLLLTAIQPQSVLDIGCGDGTWLSVFEKHGIKDYLGVDGPHVDSRVLEIPRRNFVARDLMGSLDFSHRFDLAVSLEVAEHLPVECARKFVGSLTRAAPVVAFSAAVPYQGGAGHVNEQWQEYWADLFRENGYVAVDFVRPKLWERKDVAVWYIQNLIVYVEKANISNYPKLELYSKEGKGMPLSVIHPRLYLGVHRLENWNLRKMIKSLSVLTYTSIKWHLLRQR